AHTEPLQAGLVEQDDPFKRGLIEQDLDAQWFIVHRAHEPLVANLVAGLTQKARAFAQIGARFLRAAEFRIGVRRGENLWRHLVAHGLEDRELLALRQARARELAAVEVAADPLVLAEEELLVGFLEIERVVEGAPYSRILEF